MSEERRHGFSRCTVIFVVVEQLAHSYLMCDNLIFVYFVLKPGIMRVALKHVSRMRRMHQNLEFVIFNCTWIVLSSVMHWITGMNYHSLGMRYLFPFALFLHNFSN